MFAIKNVERSSSHFSKPTTAREVIFLQNFEGKDDKEKEDKARRWLWGRVQGVLDDHSDSGLWRVNVFVCSFCLQSQSIYRHKE